MSELRCFTLLGDSNIGRNVNKNSCRGNVFLKNAQVISCGNLSIFDESLKSIRAESDSVILSCFSNFLASADGPVSISQRVDPVLEQLYDGLLLACGQFPDRQYLLSPPMYRTSPVWYREGLAEILSLFSQTFRRDKPDNLHLLPSFATPEYDSGGVHLTPYSGLEFLMHLFDSANDLLDQLLLPPEERAEATSEANRVLEDRVMVLEQDHRRLNRVVEDKTASDEELHDFHENERLEIWFVISGLPAIPSEIVGKEWQDRAVREVQAILVTLMGREMEIIVVKNATTRQKDAETTYNVKMANLNDSKDLRRKFGSFYLGGQDKRPDGLKHVNIKSHLTPNTRIRISVLKLLAKRYKDSNPSARAQVISYDPRPMLKISPGPDSTDRRVMMFNYVEAVKKFPTNFSEAEINPIIRRINLKLSGRIRSIFVILSDDQFRKVTSRFAPRPEPAGDAPAPSGVAEQVAQPDPPAQNPHSDTSGPRSSSNRSKSGKRGDKRGAASMQGNPAKK